MTIKIGDKEFNFDGYANSNEIAKALDEVYQQGRADALDIDMDKPMHFTDEQKAWLKNYIIINAKRQRADAIEKVQTYLRLHRKYGEHQNDDFVFYHHMYEWLEELKEQKNE